MAASPISYVGNAQGAADSNPTSGNFTVHANTRAGDLVIAQWYSRANTKTFSKPGTVNQLIDVSTANGGHLFVGWWVAAGSSDSKGWTAGSVSNGSTGWGTTTMRGVDVIAPFRYSGSVAGGSTSNPDPPSISTGAGDAMVVGFGHMDDWGTYAAPASFTDGGWWETTAGTDAAGGMAYDLDGGTGSAVNAATFGTATAANYWYAWAGSLTPMTLLPKTLVPVYNIKNRAAKNLAGGIKKAFSQAADGSLYGYSNVYATARSTYGGATADSSQVVVGQNFSTPNYSVQSGYVSFDTSGIPAAATINKVTLRGYVSALLADTAFTVQARLKDWSTTLGSEDWVAGASLSALTLLATTPSSGMAVGRHVEFTEEGGGVFGSNVNRTGVTRLLLTTAAIVAGTTPTNLEQVTFSSSEGISAMTLEVEYDTPVNFDIKESIAAQLRKRQLASGGHIRYDGDYVVHIFNGSGSLVVPGTIRGAEVLVVGGGGGGTSGGGGAGGYLPGTETLTGTMPVTVGTGGAGENTYKLGASYTAGDGEDSVFGSYTAKGGGGAGGNCSIGSYCNGRPGGSGGGSSATGAFTATGGDHTGSPASQGNHGGGNGSFGDPYPSGGGGGAAADGGTAASSTAGGAGGAGYTNDIVETGHTGAGHEYAGGGSGGLWQGTGTYGGATHGGGTFSRTDGEPVNGAANTGGGGGGIWAGPIGYTWTNVGGNGGSGVVIVRYLAPYFSASGGTVTFEGPYTVHKFTSSGSLVCSGSLLAAYVEVLVVGGGGPGGNGLTGGSGRGGGGGGGGEVYLGSIDLSGTMTVTVGGSGQNSVLGSRTALAGGAGGNYTAAGGSGASGGGSGSEGSDAGVGSPQFDGGHGQGAGTAGAGGGGGKNEVGGPGAAGYGGYGAGYYNAYSSDLVQRGSLVIYGSGGGGGGYNDGGPAGSGAGAGGDNTSAAVAGTANTGGGGGGGGSWSSDAAGKAGGSGIVVVRYLTFGILGGTAVAVEGADTDGYIQSTNATYLTARSGGTLTVETGSYGLCVQDWVSSQYWCYESFLSFDTSAYTSAISAAYLVFYAASLWNGGGPFSVRTKDWGAAIDTGDWVAGASIGSLPLVGNGYVASVDFQWVALDPLAINKGGVTRLLLALNKLTDGTAPAATEGFSFTQNEFAGQYRPRLFIRTKDEGAVQYRVQNKVPQTLVPIYDILVSALTALKTLTTSYNIIQHLPKTLTTPFNIRNLLAKTLALPFNIRNKAAKTIAAAYQIFGRATKTLTTPYNIRNLLAKTLTLPFNIIGRATKTLVPAYNIIQHLAQTLTPPYNIRGLAVKTLTATFSILGSVTAVLKTLVTGYSIRNLAAKTLAMPYQIRGLATKTIAATYNIIQHLAKTLTSPYNIRGKALKTIAPVYNIIQHLAKTLTPTYNIIQHLAKTLTPPYQIRNKATKTLSATYSIIQHLAKTLVLPYNIRNKALKTLTATYSIIQHLAKVLTPTYTIRNLLAKTLVLPYQIRNMALKTLTLPYSIRQLSTKTLVIIYNIQSTITAVLKTLVPSYSIIQHLAKTLVSSYFILGRSAKTLVPTFSIRNLLAKTLALPYQIRGRAVKTLSATYNIIQHLGKTIVAGYQILGRATKTLTTPFNIRTLIAKSLTATYEILGVRAVLVTLTAAYGVMNLATKTLSPTYRILTHAAEVTLQAGYSISRLVLKSLTTTYKIFRYEIFGTILPGLGNMLKSRGKIVRGQANGPMVTETNTMSRGGWKDIQVDVQMGGVEIEVFQNDAFQSPAFDQGADTVPRPLKRPGPPFSRLKKTTAEVKRGQPPTSPGTS